MNNKVHENLVLKLGVQLEIKNNTDIMVIGDTLVSEGLDALMPGGFWIWDINSNVEFYSPNFRASLGFDGELDFPSIPQSWQDQINPEHLQIAINNYNKNVESGGEHAYHQIVEYNTKQGSKLTVLCSGTLIKDVEGLPLYLVGSHKINF